MFDLGAYLQRIGLAESSPTLAAVHLAHVTAIPFESLDPYLGPPVSLAVEDIAGKLVERRRGGYCFEQNLLLKAALEALGAEVDLYLARGLFGGDPAKPRPRTHLMLGVRWHGEHWHADVGFGGGTPLEPIPWGPGEVHEQAGWRFRVLERHPEYVLQNETADGWEDLYAFIPHPVPAVDIGPANWWTSTHPDSRFKRGFLVSRQWRDGRRLALSDWGELVLIERTSRTEVREPVAPERIPGLLAQRFGLPGFELDATGRLVHPEALRR